MRKQLSIAALCFGCGVLAQTAELAPMSGTTMAMEAPAYELISFVAIPAEGAGIRLQWSTGSEPPGTRFLVERSTDRMNWSTAFSYDGEGADREFAAYAFMDLDPSEGVSYYRLSARAVGRWLDISDDFAVEYHLDRALRIQGGLSPGRFTVESSGTITHVQLLNNRGQFLAMEISYGEGLAMARAEGLEPGTYYVQALVNGIPVLQPVVVTAEGVFGG